MPSNEVKRGNDLLLPMSAWLDVTCAVFPLRGVLFVGAGARKGAWHQWLQSQKVALRGVPVHLVEGDETNYRHLQRDIGADDGWTLWRDVIVPSTSSTAFHRPGNQIENADTLDTLYEKIGGDINWLLVDCLPAAALLQGGRKMLEQVDVALVRVASSLSPELLAHQQAVDDVLEASGLRRIHAEAERNPAVAQALYMRDAPRLMKAAHQAEQAGQRAQNLRGQLQAAQPDWVEERFNSVNDGLPFSKDREFFNVEDAFVVNNNYLERVPIIADFTPLDNLHSLFINTEAKEYINKINKEIFEEIINACLEKILGEQRDSDLVVDRIFSESRDIVLIHVENDYIPSKIIKDNNYYERELLDTISNFYESNGIFIDIGANIGNHTLYFADVLGARVISFEPQPHNIMCLELNAVLNGFSNNISVHRYALGASNAKTLLRMSIESNYGTFSAKPGSNPRANSEAEGEGFIIPIKVLDEVMDDSYPDQKVSIIKIDVEGMELDVIKGGYKTIEKWRPLIVCECFNREIFDSIEGYLRRLDYYPMASMNATPTFIFYSADNDFHMSALASYLRFRAISDASKNKNFVS